MIQNQIIKHNKYLDLDSLADKALSNPSILSSKTSVLVEMLAEAIECIGKLSPDKYFKHYIHFHKLVYGNHFDENLYEYATSLMKNIDGTEGSTIDFKYVEEEAKKYGLLSGNMISKWDVFYIYMMNKSDYWDTSATDEENHALMMRLTRGFFMDKDNMSEGKALRFFTKVAMFHPNEKR